jgi:hypothetical protein
MLARMPPTERWPFKLHQAALLGALEEGLVERGVRAG